MNNADLPDVGTTIADLQERDVVARIWRGDHTVWKDDPTEITNRLGWLTITDFMRDHIGDLKAFAEEIKGEGYRHVVLLGMGGSSLGPEVIRQTFGSVEGYPELIVLDSTVPAWVQKVTDSIDPAKTLFIVSSKSGSTTEPNVFYRHFRSLVDQAIGKDEAGKNFVAVTDPGSDLETLGKNEGFRRVFSNPPELGGRYSVLSYFGIVPAVLTGLDIGKLLDRADGARKGCAPEVAANENAGAWLGAVMGALALRGRDKLTLVTSPSIASFGLWAEQLIAESTGKEGKGIVPIAGEPLLAPDAYGNDRLFVYLRLEGDDNADSDAAVEKLSSANQPVVRLDLGDKYDIGAEFYRWEFAIAVTGAVLGINPFDQPNVESAKQLAISTIQDYEKSGKAPTLEATATLSDLLSKAAPGDYLAIMAYINETPETDEVLSNLRRSVMEKHKIATTLGYGPRFLHSTGQLHKGGANNGLFLQITSGHDDDLPIPGGSYTFGILADSQAVGDFGALEAENRRAVRIHLKSGLASELKDAFSDIG